MIATALEKIENRCFVIRFVLYGTLAVVLLSLRVVLGIDVWMRILMVASVTCVFSMILSVSEVIERIWFRLIFGIFPPMTKRDWHAMKVVQSVVDEQLLRRRAVRHLSKDILTRVENRILLEKNISLDASDPKEARKMLAAARIALKQFESDRRAYQKLNRKYDNAKAVARIFSFNT